MGLRSWWKNRNAANESPKSTNTYRDEGLIAQQVPELVGMDEIEGMAYALQVIEDWKASCTEEQHSEFLRRGKESLKSWDAEGLAMPYWGSLWILRTYQHELGFDVPAVAKQVG